MHELTVTYDKGLDDHFLLVLARVFFPSLQSKSIYPADTCLFFPVIITHYLATGLDVLIFSRAIGW